MKGWLCELSSDQATLDRVGGKASNLRRLVQSGQAVPAAVVVTTEAYRACLARPEVHAAIKQVHSAEAEQLDPLLDRVRACIESAPLEEELEAELQDALVVLGEGPVAVRSSATAEDSADRSFAGQHDTVLGVCGPDELKNALRRCWASAWSRHALEYRRRQSVAENAFAMGVLIQRLIPANAAGVLFTCDPTTGQTDRLVLEAVPGLGDSLVSGKLTPDRWVIDKAQGTVLEHTVAHKPFAMRFMTGAVVRESLSAESQDSPCLETKQIRQLVKTAAELEPVLGPNLDIEWAFLEQELWLLQARPVTTLATAPQRSRLQVWSNTNLGELVPDVATPMTYSTIRRIVVSMMSPLLVRLGIETKGMDLVGLVGGRVYANMNTIVAMMREMPGMRGKNYADFFGGDQAALRPALARLTDDDLPKTKLSFWKTVRRLPGFVFWLVSHQGLRTEATMRAYARQIDEDARFDLKGASDSELLDRTELLLDVWRGEGDALAFALVGTTSAQLLTKLCQRWLGDSDGTLVHRLLAGVGGVESAEAGLALWRLAQAGRRQGVREVLETDECFAQVRSRLEGQASGREFLSEWDAFLERHGHHTRAEIDVAVPRWREQPDYLLSLIRSYLAAPSSLDPVAQQRARAKERVELTERCRKQLGPLRRRIFKALLDRSQRCFAVREEGKSGMVRRVALLRETLLALGDRLQQRQTLEAKEDVLFLSLEELPAALSQQTGANFKPLVALRRAEHQQYLCWNPPPVVVGHYAGPEEDSRVEPLLAITVLKGISVSPGVATGPARVILRADSEARVLPGEILIAPFTDPGWTPYFLPAAAIVMDQGGVLSHGSIVAREYGIPAVVNVGPATQILRTGQTVRVDANRGEVSVLSPAPSEPSRDAS